MAPGDKHGVRVQQQDVVGIAGVSCAKREIDAAAKPRFRPGSTYSARVPCATARTSGELELSTTVTSRSARAAARQSIEVVRTVVRDDDV